MAWRSVAQDAVPRRSAGLLLLSLDPANVCPMDAPEATGKIHARACGPMTDTMRLAIHLFDGSVSERYYNLANCLDGLTFGLAIGRNQRSGTSSA